MCAKFEMRTEGNSFFEDLKKYLEENEISFVDEHLIKAVSITEIRPTTPLLTITKNGGYAMKPMAWGWKHSYHPDKAPTLLFNSKIETLTTKPWWFKIFAENRCLILMTSFNENVKSGNEKVWHRVYLPGESFFFAAGIYKAVEGKLHTSMITTEPNTFMSKIHHRMPVLFKKNDALKFLTNSPDENKSFCKPLDDSIKMAMEVV